MTSALVLCALLAGGAVDPYNEPPVTPLVCIDPYQDELDELERGRQSIRKQDGGQSSGGGAALPSLIHVGASYYPTFRFEHSALSSRTATGFDAFFGLQTFLSSLVPWHTHIGLVIVEDKGDFDLSVIKIGTGIHTTVTGNMTVSFSVGAAYLYGSDVGGTRFTGFFELRVGTRDFLVPGSYVSIGYFNVNNVHADLNDEPIDSIEAILLTVGFGGS